MRTNKGTGQEEEPGRRRSTGQEKEYRAGKECRAGEGVPGQERCTGMGEVYPPLCAEYPYTLVYTPARDSLFIMPGTCTPPGMPHVHTSEA